MDSSVISDEVQALLSQVTKIACKAGERLMALYSADTRPSNRDEMVIAARRNEDTSLDYVRPALERLRPGARWIEDEHEKIALPFGEWWCVDAVEGNVNHVHGCSKWGVSITLLRDGEPILAVFHQPVGNLTWRSVRGAGAQFNGRPLCVSAKREMDAAVTAVGPAGHGQHEGHRRLGNSIAAMLDQVLLVRAEVPSTFPMLLVASGQNDLFWQYGPALSDMAAGVLFVTEAGGVATRVDGSPWTPGAPDVLVCTKGLHVAAVATLAGL